MSEYRRSRAEYKRAMDWVEKNVGKFGTPYRDINAHERGGAFATEAVADTSAVYVRTDPKSGARVTVRGGNFYGGFRK